jgi:hypothetical protein
MRFDLGGRRPKPAVAIGDHSLVVNDGLGRFNDRRIEFSSILAIVEQDDAHTLVVASLAQELEPVRRYRLAPLVGVAIGVPQRDRAVETVGRARGPLFQADRGRRNGTASLGKVRERALDRHDFGVIAVRSRGDQHVLDRAAKAQMHLAHKGVHRAEIAREVGEHLDCVVADLK